MRRNPSNYRQMRVTLTEEARGYISVRIMVKPLESQWSHMHTIVSHRWKPSTLPASVADVAAELADFLLQSWADDS